MPAATPFLIRHGYLVLFLNVLVEQLGLPVPAVPVLLAIGALAGLGDLSLWTALALAICACLASDVLWFRLGRTRGHSVLNLLCRISLEPDSCVSRTKSIFAKMGASALLIAKFVPGLNAAAAPLAGLTRMAPLKFLAADAAGAAAWSAAYLYAGFLFRNQLEKVAEQAGRLGSRVLIVLAILLGAYIGWKYYERRRFIRDLRVARVSPERVLKMISDGEEITIVDLRQALDVELDPVKLPNAVWIDAQELDTRIAEIPLERDVVLYCT